MRRGLSGAPDMLSVLPDVIVVDGETYTDVRRDGLYRDEYGRSYSRQQIMMAAHLDWRAFGAGNQTTPTLNPRL